MSTAKSISLFILIMLYFLAGLNHFIHPEFYVRIIPPYLPYPELLVVLSGIAEIILAILLIFKTTRKWACYGIIAMLLAFIPIHVHHIQLSGCDVEGFCVPIWVTWIRLAVVHPILVIWVWWHRK